MKSLALILLLTNFLFTFSCSKSVIPTNSVKPISSKKILEITSDFHGAWWMNGEVLDIRLYDDGMAEYDEYPTYNSTGTVVKAENVKKLKQINISPNELKEILDLLKNDELLKSKNDLVQQKFCTDAVINTRITFDDTNEINIKNHCATLSSTNSIKNHFKDFPSKIAELFQKIKRIKDKESAAKFYG
jgi:hypothetical protein